MNDQLKINDLTSYEYKTILIYIYIYQCDSFMYLYKWFTKIKK